MTESSRSESVFSREKWHLLGLTLTFIVAFAASKFYQANKPSTEVQPSSQAQQVIPAQQLAK